ncbi:MAG: protein kinase domain-containing protein [Nannocystaceae bacterium]|nr:serine/threonine protein kinase [bacterium]
MGLDDSGDGAPTPEPSDPQSAVRKHVHAALFGGDAPRDVDRNGVPTQVGRFRTTRVLGTGGMGTVLAGFDDELERPVAVKLLHREIGIRHAERLRREAKALAKLSHPNVVTVYEVGHWQDRLFIAMEQVQGVTLGAWVAERERSVDELLDMFLRTGAGLVAAHGRDLVHRDFKPDNVIVGTDGRPRILDFGLVQTLEEEQEDGLHAPAAGAGSDADPTADTVAGITPAAGSLTETGTVLGTPAYMPAEQLAGKKTTAASDQFAFCVALWEALYGARPFAGRTVGQLAASVTQGKLVAPKHPRGSGRLRRALERGLCPDPAARWPAMQPLLDELSDLRTVGTRRRRSAVLGAAVAVALGGATWGFTRPQASNDPGCRPAQERLKPVWTEGIKERMRLRYMHSEPRAQEFFRTEMPLLDDWAQTWATIYTEACEGDEAERDPSMFEKRMTCLDVRLLELQVRTIGVAELSPEVAAAAASGDYMPFYFPGDCQNDALVAATTPLPDAQRATLFDNLLQLRIMEQRGKAAYFGEPGIAYEPTVAKGNELIEKVYATDYLPAKADFLARRGNGDFMAGLVPLEKGLEMLYEGARVAEKTGSDQTFVLANLWALRSLKTAGRSDYATPEVLAQLPRWESALERSGWPIYGTTEFRAWQAVVLASTGDLQGARLAAAQSITFARERFGPEHPFYRRTLSTTAYYLLGTPLHDEAERYLQTTIDSIEAAEGTTAYNLLLPLGIQTEVMINTERFDEALVSGRRVLEIATLHHGDVGSHVSQARAALARVHAARGEFEKVEALLAELWSTLEHDVGSFIAVPAELHANYAAARGVPDPKALERLKPVESHSPFTKMIIAAVTPLLDDQPTEQALEAIDEAMKIDPSPQAVALAKLVRGHVLERAGRLREAAAAFGESASCDCTAINGAMVLYAATLGQVRTLRALGDPSAEPIAQAFAERLARTSSSRAFIERLDATKPVE